MAAACVDVLSRGRSYVRLLNCGRLRLTPLASGIRAALIDDVLLPASCLTPSAGIFVHGRCFGACFVTGLSSTLVLLPRPCR